ncbi:MAG: hypothetical protein ACHP7N_01465 [Caulobacterales bacterium]
MHRTLMIVAALAFALAAGAANAVAVHGPLKPTADTSPVRGIAPVCKHGKLCGHTCIAKNKVCHKPTPRPDNAIAIEHSQGSKAY